MDKWEELTNRVKQGLLAEEPDATLAGALQLFAEFGRTLDRIANALEKDTITCEPLEHDL